MSHLVSGVRLYPRLWLTILSKERTTQTVINKSIAAQWPLGGQEMPEL